MGRPGPTPHPSTMAVMVNPEWTEGPQPTARLNQFLSTDPLDEDPLPVPDGMHSWEPWPPRLAAALFLAKLRDLIRAYRANE